MTWTISRELRDGDTFVAGGHKMKVVQVVEWKPTCNVAVVSVVDSETSAPPLRFAGEFNSETRAADNAYRGPRQK